MYSGYRGTSAALAQGNAARSADVSTSSRPEGR
jgi:hypothetical protein